MDRRHRSTSHRRTEGNRAAGHRHQGPTVRNWDRHSSTGHHHRQTLPGVSHPIRQLTVKIQVPILVHRSSNSNNSSSSNSRRVSSPAVLCRADHLQVPDSSRRNRTHRQHLNIRRTRNAIQHRRVCRLADLTIELPTRRTSIPNRIDLGQVGPRPVPVPDIPCRPPHRTMCRHCSSSRHHRHTSAPADLLPAAVRAMRPVHRHNHRRRRPHRTRS